MTEHDDEYDELVLQVGAYSRHSPYEGLTDEQADKLQAELEEQEARRLPFGFRA